MEKCFYDEKIEEREHLSEITVLKNERVCFQILYCCESRERRVRQGKVTLLGDLAKYATVRNVVHMPSMQPMNQNRQEGAYLRCEPGMYPDLLRPLHYNGETMMPRGRARALWVEIELPENIKAGEYTIGASIYSEYEPEHYGETFTKIKVLDALLPKQTLIHTEWFYTDCIAMHYGARIFSERHWRLIESFLKTATRNGINMILTPVFTPELDTYIGGERPTTQLVDIELGDDGDFKFGFEKLHRWIELCLRCGVEYFEIPHFFTQWGAKNAPKIIVKVNGKKKKYFGWHTDAMGEEYEKFLSQFIPALLGEFKKYGLDKKCFFHVSDEPSLSALDHYKRCKKLLNKYLAGYPIIDALSEYEFYEKGALEKPVPHTRDIQPFIDNKVPGLWAYYCQTGSPVSDRFFSMPLWRTRMIGVQLYLYNIEGFLHWGYNFYNNRKSFDRLDPFLDSTGEYFVASGDTYLVYPGDDETAWESLRINAMREAMDDMRALRLYEKKFGREATERLILDGAGGKLTFLDYPQDPDYLPNLRKKIYEAVANP